MYMYGLIILIFLVWNPIIISGEHTRSVPSYWIGRIVSSKHCPFDLTLYKYKGQNNEARWTIKDSLGIYRPSEEGVQR